MPEYEDRIKKLGEAALRDVIRLTIVASSEEGEEQEATQPTADQINFLDTNAVSKAVAGKLQESINSIISGTITVGDKEIPKIEVVEFRIGDFKFDKDYTERRKKIADARAGAEAARFEKAEAERKADAIKARAVGEADAIRLIGTAEAHSLKARVEAAGGANQLRAQTLAEKWNGETPKVVGGENVIVDSRFAPGTSTVVPVTEKTSPKEETSPTAEPN